MRRWALVVGLVIVLPLMGCAGSAHHRRYTWSPSTGTECPSSFAEDTRACLNVGYIPVLFGGGPAIWRGEYEGCMKSRGYQQIGDIARIPEARSPQLMEWEKQWPWPESPPASAWAGVRRFGGVDFTDAVCRAGLPAAAPVAAPRSLDERLKELEDLRAAGRITDEEYAQLRRKAIEAYK